MKQVMVYGQPLPEEEWQSLIDEGFKEEELTQEFLGGFYYYEWQDYK